MQKVALKYDNFMAMKGLGVRSLESIFNRSKPKSKYMAEMHVEDEVDSISKEIINGDILISRNKTNVHLIIFDLLYNS